MKTLTIDYTFNPKQKIFINSDGIDEVCYGGAAGGGKTFIQCYDALRYALKYEGSTQLVIRRTYRELENSVAAQMQKMYPDNTICKYNQTKHLWMFANGSTIELGYLARASDVYYYQGMEAHVIRIDEATHLPYSSVEYLRTRVRSADTYPKGMRFSTNPGGIGHLWVKNRYVDPVPPFNIFRGKDKLTRLYLPASVYDNKVLMKNDPEYVARLESMKDPVQREMLLNGNWNVAAGAFFGEFSVEKHVVEPFDVTNNKDVKLYRSIDYGLDMLACYWYAELPPTKYNPNGSIYVYRELCAPNLTISEAAKRIREATPPSERIICTYAPHDVVTNRDRVTGRNQADIFAQHGVSLTKINSMDRKAGWVAVKEHLHVRESGRPILRIFSTCRELIKYLPMAQHDEKNYGDICKEPHSITHSLDSLRYFCVFWHANHSYVEPEEDAKRVKYDPDMLRDYRRASPSERESIEKMMGGKPKYN